MPRFNPRPRGEWVYVADTDRPADGRTVRYAPGAGGRGRRRSERSTNIESVLGEFPDKLDELVGSVAVAPSETEQFVHVLEHDSVLECAGDSDSLAAAELQ